MIFAANFKTNLTRSLTAAYINELNSFVESDPQENQYFVFPPSTALDEFKGKVKVGAQNAYNTENGAFTGEIGLEQLNEFNISTILIGHSERRHILGESQEEIVKKYDFYKNMGFTIVYCIGEPLEVREEGNAELLAYLDDQLEGIDLLYPKLIVAYEPVWAIGTGLTPTVHDIELIHNALSRKIKAPILYGGSVKPDNARDILSIENVDGVLVGGASLKVEDFKKIINN